MSIRQGPNFASTADLEQRVLDGVTPYGGLYRVTAGRPAQKGTWGAFSVMLAVCEKVKKVGLLLQEKLLKITKYSINQ